MRGEGGERGEAENTDPSDCRGTRCAGFLALAAGWSHSLEKQEMLTCDGRGLQSLRC